VLASSCAVVVSGFSASTAVVAAIAVSRLAFGAEVSLLCVLRCTCACFSPTAGLALGIPLLPGLVCCAMVVHLARVTTSLLPGPTILWGRAGFVGAEAGVGEVLEGCVGFFPAAAEEEVLWGCVDFVLLEVEAAEGAVREKEEDFFRKEECVLLFSAGRAAAVAAVE